MDTEATSSLYCLRDVKRLRPVRRDILGDSNFLPSTRKNRPKGRPFREKNSWRIFQNPGRNAPNLNVYITGRP